jgi:hypothetical protein
MQKSKPLEIHLVIIGMPESQPRTQALCVVLWLARPLRGPRGLKRLGTRQPESYNELMRA